MDEGADRVKRFGSIKRGDILVIPAGTHFDIPVYQGRRSYTFPETVRIRVGYVDYSSFEIDQIDDQGNFTGAYMMESRAGEYSCHLPKYQSIDCTPPDSIIPDWSQFKINQLGE